MPRRQRDPAGSRTADSNPRAGSRGSAAGPLGSQESRTSRVVGVFVFISSGGGLALAQVTHRVSVGPGGVQPNNECFTGSITPDGRYVVFESYGDNLVAGDANFWPDVFVRDLATGTNELVSLSSTGQQSDGTSAVRAPYSREPLISDDGRYVVFWSEATNLVPGAAGRLT
jgi:hypothetical protein